MRYLVAATTTEDGGNAGVFVHVVARAFVSARDDAEAVVEFIGKTGYCKAAGHDRLSLMPLTEAQYEILHPLPRIEYNG